MPTITTLLILDIGGLVGSGGAFEKVFLLYNPMTYEYIGANDLTEVMQGIGNRTLFPVFSIAFSIVLYLVAVLIVEWAFSVFERKKTNP